MQRTAGAKHLILALHLLMKQFNFPISSLLFMLIICSFASCWGFYTKPRGVYTETRRWAWRPVYALDTSYRIVTYTNAQPVVNAGKIYVKDNFIYQCEIGAGIHITDNTDPSEAKRIGFISIPGCEEISIKGNVLYTNNYYDLVAIDISHFQNPQVISRTSKAFYSGSGMPHSWEQPKDTGYYQCADNYSDSVIVGWKKDSVFAHCYKP